MNPTVTTVQRKRRGHRRRAGSGHLFIKIGTDGTERWYAKWYRDDGKQTVRSLGLVDHMSPAEAEEKLARLMKKPLPKRWRRGSLAAAYGYLRRAQQEIDRSDLPRSAIAEAQEALYVAEDAVRTAMRAQ